MRLGKGLLTGSQIGAGLHSTLLLIGDLAGGLHHLTAGVLDLVAVLIHGVPSLPVNLDFFAVPCVNYNVAFGYS